nr:uncharacterized protein LOC113829439 [Penaeus vannamei]
MLELMESSCGGGGGPGMGGTKGGRIPSRMSGSSTPPARSSPSHSREGSPLLLKRGPPAHAPLAGQLSAPPVQQYHERLHASLKRSNSLKRLLKLPIFGGQTATERDLVTLYSHHSLERHRPRKAMLFAVKVYIRTLYRPAYCILLAEKYKIRQYFQ